MAAHGVVLGGGGVVGVAWELGVLAALHDEGLAPINDARIVVGTSAGSLVASHLLRGASIADLVALQHEPTGRTSEPSPEPDLNVLADLFNTWTKATSIDEETARRVCDLAMRAPTISEDDLIALTTSHLPGGAWPERPLLVTAVACSTGVRTAWSAETDVDLRRAVASSCSVPGLFPPVTVDPAADERYVDGGLWSGTNADLVRDDGLDAVLIVESMSVINGQLGALSKRTLDAEVAALESTGVQVATVSPSPAYTNLGPHLMDPAHRSDGLDLGRADGKAAVPAVRELLEG